MTSEKISSRERVMAALNFEQTDRIPKDLGGMASTGISAFAYPRLVKALGLAERRIRVHDSFQMLALPELDVLDALGCDVVAIHEDVTNGIEQRSKWAEFDFNGRLKAYVRNAGDFEVLEDGTIFQKKYNSRMPPSSYVFDEEHGGQPLDLSAELPRPELKEVEKAQQEALPSDEQIEDLTRLCRQAREATDKAILISGAIYTGIGITYPGGIAIFPMLCVSQPEYVADLHELMTEYAVKRIEKVLPAIADYVDIIMMTSDDWGTQNSLIAGPAVYEKLFLPYLKRINDLVHKIAPGVKIFLHSCGAIYDILDLIIDSGFDVLNPVQWPAGGHSYKRWKDKCRKKIALWGGGVNAQSTLAFGTVEEVVKEVSEVVSCLAGDSGYVFNSIHNILAETEAEKITAMYRAVGEMTF